MWRSKGRSEVRQLLERQIMGFEGLAADQGRDLVQQGDRGRVRVTRRQEVTWKMVDTVNCATLRRRG